MQVGDLVRFVGVPALYRSRVGVVVAFDSSGPLVHFAGMEYEARDEPRNVPGFKPTGGTGFHPMYYNELEVISS
jgi:hypothetical protein